MGNYPPLTAAQIRYLLSLKKLNAELGVKSADLARDLKLTRASVHNMLTTLLSLGYIEKQPGGRVFLTELGVQKAKAYQAYHDSWKRRLLRENKPDEAIDIALCAFLAELPETHLKSKV